MKINWKELLMDKGSLLLIVVIGSIIGMALYAWYNKKYPMGMASGSPPTTPPAPVVASGQTSSYHGKLRNGQTRPAYQFS